MANRTLNFEAGNGNWWRRCNHKRKVLIGSEHTFHWLHWHTSCSFSGKNGWKLWGNYEIWFGFFDNGLWRELMVSLVIFSESISSGQSVLIKIWCSVEILKLIWPKKVTLAKLNSTLGSVVPLAMFRNIISAFNLIAYCSQTQGKAVWSYKITFSYYEREICQHRQLKVRPGPTTVMAAWSSSVLISCYRVPKLLRPWQSFWTSQAMQPSVFSFVCPSLSLIVHLSSP